MGDQSKVKNYFWDEMRNNIIIDVTNTGSATNNNNNNDK